MVIIGFIIFFLFLLLFFYSTVDWKEKEERKKIEELCYQELVDQEKKNKGLAFEQQITEMVTEKLKGAFVINNCILNKKNKEGNDIYWNGTIASKEFDIIILSKKGLFVIEAKNYAQAFISGNLNDKTWLTSYSKSKIFQVYSPMKQVTEGVLTLKRYLPDFNFKKLVVFPDSTKF